MAFYNGTPQSDYFVDYFNRHDTMRGRGGNDSLEGMGGNDNLYGGDGTDTLEGGDGNDNLYGENSYDTLQGGRGQDKLYGGAGDDAMNGGTGDDELRGGSGNDLLLGHYDDDKLYGEGDHDILYGHLGNDYLNGGSGNDILKGGGGYDTLTGGSGMDRLQGYEANGRRYGDGLLKPDHLQDIEQDTLISGSMRDRDTFVLGDGRDVFYHYAGRNDFARIKDFDTYSYTNETDYDRIDINGSINNDTIVVVGSNTEISYQGDLIAILEDVNLYTQTLGNDISVNFI